MTHSEVNETNRVRTIHIYYYRLGSDFRFACSGEPESCFEWSRDDVRYRVDRHIEDYHPRARVVHEPMPEYDVRGVLYTNREPDMPPLSSLAPCTEDRVREIVDELLGSPQDRGSIRQRLLWVENQALGIQ